MKLQIILIMGFLSSLFGCHSQESKSNLELKSVYDISIISLAGDTINLGEFKGKKNTVC